MKNEDPRRAQLDRLVEAIWGPGRMTAPPAVPRQRERQNAALAAAIRAYLQGYLDEAEPATPRADLRGGIELPGADNLE